uniref:Uncharacterized protein n=1 Tax=Arundo donax TaxID=35708 RepID=A0A0A8XVX9_ARUDO
MNSFHCPPKIFELAQNEYQTDICYNQQFLVLISALKHYVEALNCNFVHLFSTKAHTVTYNIQRTNQSEKKYVVLKCYISKSYPSNESALGHNSYHEFQN